MVSHAVLLVASAGNESLFSFLVIIQHMYATLHSVGRGVSFLLSSHQPESDQSKALHHMSHAVLKDSGLDVPSNDLR